jgi:hypothetical protein
MSAVKIEWSRDPEFWSATAAEHAFVGPYELVAFDIPPSDQFPARGYRLGTVRRREIRDPIG